MSVSGMPDEVNYGEAVGSGVAGGLGRPWLRDKVRGTIYGAQTMLEDDEDPDEQRAQRVGKVAGQVVDQAIGALAGAAGATAGGPVGGTLARVASGATSGAVTPVLEVYVAESTKLLTDNVRAVRDAAAEQAPGDLAKALIEFHPAVMTARAGTRTVRRVSEFFQNRF
ncbi:hypothetical protein KOI35_38570 [Actinoplanes bogorensis]|uniref:Uncharacterized protein n=1 Tax=Paractinoplanes bogorensis TaxID=1610840 RepID=A0ABS5Z165_9ACTN|nr:hypothetical protein [Actinoplanes bogorensis]MBU2669434.1 hypothetical protein [Actinoplanes bogorensis]